MDQQKKIGIITLPLNTNYGGILQAYALQTIIESLGFHVQVLDTPRYPSRPVFSLIYLKRIIKKLFGKYKAPIFLEKEYNSSYPIVAKYTDNFIRKYIHRVHIHDFSVVNVNEFYGFVVGSDQVWRASYFRYIKDAFFLFTGDADVKRIAYAPSLGVDKWEYSEELTDCCKTLLKDFTAVSLREDSGVDLFKDYMDCSAEHVLDPTMLLSKEHYMSLCDDLFEIDSHKDCILSYLLDPTETSGMACSFLEKKLNSHIYTLNKQTEDTSLNPHDRIAPPVQAWFKAFDEAKFVITDSFHACVFSILFHKPFVVLTNKNRGIARIHSLLRMFKLEDRIVYSFSELSELYYKSIDWDQIDGMLNKWRHKSILFLSRALND